jgi:hypothetical protein
MIRHGGGWSRALAATFIDVSPGATDICAGNQHVRARRPAEAGQQRASFELRGA